MTTPLLCALLIVAVANAAASTLLVFTVAKLMRLVVETHRASVVGMERLDGRVAYLEEKDRQRDSEEASLG